MAEFSMLPWETQTGTGDGAFSYNQTQANEFFRDFSNANPATAGVLYGVDGMLEVIGSSSALKVETGKAICYARYWNDSTADASVPTPAADMGFAVVLRTVWSTNTTRIAVKTSGSGVTTIPGLNQTAGTIWEIYLATGVIDNAGNIWTDATKTTAGTTDGRCYAISPLAGMIKLRSYTSTAVAPITISNIQNDLSHLKILISPGRSTSNLGTPAWLDIDFANASESWELEYQSGGAWVTANGSGSGIERVALIPNATGSSWGQSITELDIYFRKSPPYPTGSSASFAYRAVMSYANISSGANLAALNYGTLVTTNPNVPITFTLKQNSGTAVDPQIGTRIDVYGRL